MIGEPLNDLTNDQLIKLRSYLELSNDEQSEANILMIELLPYAKNQNPDLADLLFEDLADSLKWFEENTKIVKKKEVQTIERLEREFVT